MSCSITAGLPGASIVGIDRLTAAVVQSAVTTPPTPPIESGRRVLVCMCAAARTRGGYGPTMRKMFVRIGLAAAVALGTAVVPVHTAGAAITDPIVVVWDTNAGGGADNQREGTFNDGNGGTLAVFVTGAGALQAFPIVSMATPSEYGTLSGTHDALAHASQLQAFFEFTFAGTVSEANVVFRDIKAYQSAMTPSGYTITAGSGETVSCSVETGLASTSMSNNVWTLHTSGIMSGKLLCTGSFTKLKFTPTGYTMGNVGSIWWDRMTLVVDASAIPSPTPPPPTPDTTPVAPAYTG